MPAFDASLLPTKSSDFGDESYWRDFFLKRNGRSFEWYCSHRALAEIARRHLGGAAGSAGAAPSVVLHVGCGSSALPQAFMDAAATSGGAGTAAADVLLFHSDYCEPVVLELKEQLDAKCSFHADQREGAVNEFFAADVLQLPFRAGAVDLAISKGLIDAMFNASTAEHRAGVTALMREVDRVLAPGGTYVMVSLLQKHVQELLQHAISACPGCWQSLRVTPLLPRDRGHLQPFQVALTKAAPSAAAAAPAITWESDAYDIAGEIAAGAPPAAPVDGWESLWVAVAAQQERFAERRPTPSAAAEAPDKPAGGVVCVATLEMRPRGGRTSMEVLRSQLLHLGHAGALAEHGLVAWQRVGVEPLAFGLRKVVAAAVLRGDVAPEDFCEKLWRIFGAGDEEDSDLEEEEEEGEGDGLPRSPCRAVQRVQSVDVVDVRYGEAR